MAPKSYISGFVLPFLCFIPLFCFPIVGANKLSDEATMNVGSLNAYLIDMDLVMRRVHFNLSGYFSFSFNSTVDTYSVQVSTFDSFVQHVTLDRVGLYDFRMNETELYGIFHGGPETYPFESYEFNFSLSFMISGITTVKNAERAYVSVGWPLRSQFEEPSQSVPSVNQTSYKVDISFGCTLNRPLWVGYATLLPLYLIFALLGFTVLAKTSLRFLTFRMTAYVSVLGSALAYSLSIQSALPPGRLFLSVPEVLVYSIIGSATIFAILTLVSSQIRTSRFVADVVAVISSIAFLCLFLSTFYTASYVKIGAYELANILTVERIIVFLLLSGIFAGGVIHLVQLFRHHRTRSSLRSLLTTKLLDNFTRGIYASWFTLEFWLTIVVVYVWSVAGYRFAPPSYLWMFALWVAPGDIIVAGSVELALFLSLLFLLYFLPRRVGQPWLTDALGMTLFIWSLLVFMLAFGLIVFSPFIYLAILLTLTPTSMFAFFKIRQSAGLSTLVEPQRSYCT